MPAFSTDKMPGAKEWQKAAGDEDKRMKIGAALSKFETASGKVDHSVLSAAGLKTADDVQKRMDDLDKASNSGEIRDLLDAIGEVDTLSKKFVGDKAIAANKALVALLGSVTTAVKDIRKTVNKAVADAMDELDKLQTKLADDEEKKNADKGGNDDADDKDVEKAKQKIGLEVKASLGKIIAAAGKPAAPVYYFGFAQNTKPGLPSKGKWEHPSLAIVSLKPQKSSQTRLQRLLGDDKMQHSHGTVVFDPVAKKFVFTTEKGKPSAKILIAALKFQSKRGAINVKLVKEGGETEDAEDDEDITADAPEDDPTVAAKSTGQPAAKETGSKTPPVDPKVQAFLDTLKKQAPNLNAAAKLGGKVGEAIKGRVSDARDLAKDPKNIDRATQLLKEATQLAKAMLDKAKASANEGVAPAAKSAPGAAAKSMRPDNEDEDNEPETTASGSGDPSASVLQQWSKVTQDAVEGFEQLAQRIVDAYKGNAQAKAAEDAAKRVRDLPNKLKSKLDENIGKALSEKDATKRTALLREVAASAKQLQATIQGDDLMKHVDGNELWTDLKVVAPVSDTLDKLAQLA